MGTTDIPEEPKSHTFSEEVVVDEYNEELWRVKHLTTLDSSETFSDLLKRASQPPALRLVAESHTGEPGENMYKIELIDPRYFSKPIVFEIAFDSEGRIIEPETEE